MIRELGFAVHCHIQNSSEAWGHNGHSMKLTTYLHVVLKSTTHGALSPVPLTALHGTCIAVELS
jgi:hypothetical protein